MPVTRNVAWDEDLASFKGRDTTHYVITAAAIATTCAACYRRLQPDEPLSLSVDIIESTAPDGTEYVTFTDYVFHRQCSEPGLTVGRAPWKPADLTPRAARMVLTQEPLPGSPGTVVAALAYTLTPVVSFRERDGELTSALVSILLSHGFQLAMSPEYTDILQQAAEVEVEDGCCVAVTGAVLTVTVGGETIYSEQLNLKNPDDAQWLEAAGKGSALLIAGDNLVITDTMLDMSAAAHLGTLVIGYVPIKT
ncbi:hypothetical protein [Arthrobacter sp. ISL-5]|uniref:hypothetical protein n=1 Tax=Arthrobacter sp. ISL-5 TaxID=2819111 RepID=UPI001BECDCE6|nr:hypothetical protein [Arthrobacter sp. ISL-5]MBT2554917.1 hypothetical protein [Arthrobacter sp. ISL-5]